MRNVLALLGAALALGCSGDGEADYQAESAAPSATDHSAAEEVVGSETHRKNVEAVLNFFASLPEETDFVWEDSSDVEDNASWSHPEWIAALNAEELTSALAFVHTLSLRRNGWLLSNPPIVPDVREFVSSPAATSDGVAIHEFIMPVGPRGFVARAGCTSTGERAIVWDRAMRAGNKWPYYVAYIRSHEMAHHSDPRQIACAPVRYASFEGLERHTHCETVRWFSSRLSSDDLEYLLFYASSLGDPWTQEFLADASMRVRTCGM